ncbi:putative secreted protein [Proteiniphilum saccharofermentans]|uniref:Putative secreted protein n=1 Tax=Proteiniphilum saccharofermentans TaxID=1642647 RepID=A0A1R3SYA5_9BACT|nr:MULTISPECIES: hypothetical protein [Proteiniphilum]MDY9919354.1 hypothetical protein [Proteiniphilum sp.]SCD19890.1 putative secreted protein [Proteiniphilum saccharofermentans]
MLSFLLITLLGIQSCFAQAPANLTTDLLEHTDRFLGYYNDGIGTDHSSLHANMFPMVFEMEVTIPANTIAEVWVPVSLKKFQLTVDGNIYKGKVEQGFVKVEVGSGKHLFQVL